MHVVYSRNTRKILLDILISNWHYVNYFCRYCCSVWRQWLTHSLTGSQLNRRNITILIIMAGPFTPYCDKRKTLRRTDRILTGEIVPSKHTFRRENDFDTLEESRMLSNVWKHARDSVDVIAKLTRSAWSFFSSPSVTPCLHRGVINKQERSVVNAPETHESDALWW